MVSSQLRSHGEIGSEIADHNFLLRLLGKDQVCNFACAIMDKYVGDFEVSMHSIDLMKPSEAVEDLFQKGGSLILCQSLFFMKVSFQIISVAKLHGNKLSFFGAECVHIANHILILTFLENSNPSLDFLEFRSVDH